MRLPSIRTIKLPLFLRVVALYVVLGLPLWGSLTFQASLAHATPSVPMPPMSAPAPPAATPISGRPQRIIVPRLDIDLKVIKGQLDTATNAWTLSDDKALFADTSRLPNDTRGNTFIYGHNTDRVFARLAGLKVGDVVNIITSNHYTFTYQYNGDLIVQPDSTAIMQLDPATPRLTLMTCEGLWSQTRRIMFFDFVEVSDNAAN